MGIGGANGIGWDESAPQVTESAGLGASRIQSVKTSVREVVGAEHIFSSAGGDGQGVHIMGSARPWYGVQSAISSSGTDGRLYVTSDTSKLFHPGSAGTLLLGAGPTALSVGSMLGVTFPQRSYLVEEIGIAQSSSTGYCFVTYPNSGFSGMPFVQLTSVFSDGGNTSNQLVQYSQNVSTPQVGVFIAVQPGGSAISGAYIMWRSLGSRTL